MFGEYTKRQMVIGAITVLAAAGLTVEATYYILHTFVLARQDPLYLQGGLKPDQAIK